MYKNIVSFIAQAEKALYENDNYADKKDQMVITLKSQIYSNITLRWPS